MNGNSPPDEQPDEIRSSQSVARRALALFSVFALAHGGDRSEIVPWLRENGLWDELSPQEHEFVESSAPSERQIINASWQAERLIVLVWALGYLSVISAADAQCDTAVFREVLPPFADKEVREFVATARLRPASELLAFQSRCHDLHGWARSAKFHDRQPPEPVDLEIIQERHHAINWVNGYEGGLPWDLVTADT